jgi:MOSC domain-containing protein YiiM
LALLQSVNTAVPTALPGRTRLTGIYKQPRSGPVRIETLGIPGDAVLDRKHHGGPDQAVYIYFADDYRWWEGELGRAFAPGAFGENLTIDGVGGRSVAAGDRFTIGDVLLEITAHRTPCATFAAIMDEPKWVKRFHEAGRPGAYARVLAEGTIEAGQPVAVTPFTGDRFTVNKMMALDGVRLPDRAILELGLAAPIHGKMRADFERKLAQWSAAP